MATNTPNSRTTAAPAAKTGSAPRSKAATAPKRSTRGFASMDPETQRRIAAEGGRASHQSGRGHEWTSEEARAAGRKGGQASGISRSNANPTAGK